MPIAIATPTGHIGGEITRLLLERGADLVLLARKPERLPEDVRARTDVRRGTLQDADFVREATQGADALFWLTPVDFSVPPDEWFKTIGGSAARAVEANGIARVVNLSSHGAHNREGLGPVSGLRTVEEALNATGADVRHLRPGFFMENFMAQLEPIRHAGAVFFPAPPATRQPMIATRDIAARAAELLFDRSWTGKEVVGLHGPEDLTYAEAAATLGDVLGRPVEAQEVPREAVEEQMRGLGATDAWARSLGELYSRIGRAPYFDGAEPRAPDSTTPTTLADFARTSIRPALEAAPA